MLTHLDLFTGIGGFHLAAQQAGFDTIGFSEVDPYCCQLLTEKYPAIPNYGNICTADFTGLRGRVTVLSAGVPCQPASLAGKGLGDKDDRWLWPQTLDVVELVQPTWCIFENPSGIFRVDAFAAILLRLEKASYEVGTFQVPANAVGADHLRYRVFFVAHSERARSQRNDEWRGSLELWTPDEFRRSGQEPKTLANGDSSREQQQGRNKPQGREWISNSSEALANTACSGRDGWREESRSISEGEGGRDRRLLEPAGCSEASPYPNILGSSGKLGELRYQRPESISGYSKTSLPDFRITQPPICGRADGIPFRSHRLKSLGNAVSPPQAFPFFQAIYQVETECQNNYQKQL